MEPPSTSATVPSTTGFAPRTVVVTGATSGIGLAVAKALRPRVARLALVGRNPKKLEDAVRAVSTEPGEGAVRGHVADLSLLADVRRLAAELVDSYASLDVLVNNAGAYFAHLERTSEGIERTLALNVLSPYLLTRLLHAPLRAAAPSRVVNVASAAHAGARLVLDDLDRRAPYRGLRSYGRSKLELVLLTHEFARRWAPEQIAVHALHPGFVHSDFAKNNTGPTARILRLLVAVFGISPERGARTPVYVATSPALEGTTGEYFARGRRLRSSGESYTEAGAHRLWDLCAERVGLPADT
jgi:retinol dehydrogenase-14